MTYYILSYYYYILFIYIINLISNSLAILILSYSPHLAHYLSIFHKLLNRSCKKYPLHGIYPLWMYLRISHHFQNIEHLLHRTFHSPSYLHIILYYSDDTLHHILIEFHPWNYPNICCHRPTKRYLYHFFCYS